MPIPWKQRIKNWCKFIGSLGSVKRHYIKAKKHNKQQPSPSPNLYNTREENCTALGTVSLFMGAMSALLCSCMRNTAFCFVFLGFQCIKLYVFAPAIFLKINLPDVIKLFGYIPGFGWLIFCHGVLD